MRWVCSWLVIGCIGLSTSAMALEQAAPSVAQAPQLIARLGDSDFHVRREASNELRKLGAAALPALKQACQSRDPETRARAMEIVRELEYQPVPGLPRYHQARGQRLTVSILGGRRSVNVDDRGREIHISEGPGGIEMTITGQIDGQTVTRSYKARNADELRTQNAQAFALYRHWSTAAGDELNDNPFQQRVVIRGNGMNVIIVPGVQALPGLPMRPAGGDDLAGLRDRLDAQMRRLAADDRDRVHRALDDVEQSRQINALADNPDDAIERYDEACDRLRKVLGELKLPDPGAALPPPQGARLGISSNPAVSGDGAVTVNHVVAHSRAEAIGLREDDVIRKVNGQDVHGINDLRRLITQHPHGLTMDITREGQELRLSEPAKAARASD